MKTFTHTVASAFAVSLFALFVLVTGIAIAGAAPADAVRFQGEVVTPTVMLKGCTGSIIYSHAEKGTFVLTARHCVKGAETEEMTVTVPIFDKDLRRVRDEVYYAKVDMGAFYTDLALLKLLDTDRVFPVVAKVSPLSTQLAIGDAVWVAGYPATLTMSIAEGTLGPQERLAFGEWPTSKEWQRAAINMFGGNSGGALWHVEKDGSYAIIGVVTAGINGTLISVFETRQAIHEFLQRLPADVYETIAPTAPGA